jgi:carboxyl-terminal processing protease
MIVLTAFTYQSGGKYFEISKNLEIFTRIFKELNTNYVDDLDPGTLMEKGIDAMMKSLDPYTVYYTESEIEAYRFKQEGNMSGIGVDIRISDGSPVITNIYDEGPADQAGLNVGDVILQADGKVLKGLDREQVENILMGFTGTAVRLKIHSFFNKEDLDFSVERGELSINNVPHAQLLDGGIAYANLSTFTNQAASNVMKAYQDLKNEYGDELNGYILDLRDNGGGLLLEAVSLCNLFLPKNVLVVTTKSKVIDWDKSYSTQREAMDTETPLVVLVNERSASASEIVSGTIQDYDRGVLVGQRTYGKGLVQRHADVGYNSKIKLTISEYYIPSGRCIQSVRYDDDGEPIEVPLSERNSFKTKNGRLVQDGGGVLPDLVMESSELESLVDQLNQKLIIFKYVNEYLREERMTQIPENYRFEDEDKFFEYLDSLGFIFDDEITKEIEKAILKALEQDEDNLANDLQGILEKKKTKDFQLLKSNPDRLRIEIEKEISGRFYKRRGKIKTQMRNDPALKEALNLLNDPTRYESLLNN